MADEHAQAQDHAWEAVDPAPDSPLPAPSFDEPLEWPEAAAFAPENGRPVLPSDVWPDDATAPATPDGLPIQAEDQQWLAGLDLGSLDQSFAGRNGTDLEADRDLHLDPLPDSLWAAEPVAESLSQPDPVVVTGPQPAPTFYAEPDHRPGGRKKWLDVRHGNAAVVALISFVSLVLVGMFLSVRARNELPTDTSPSRTPTGEIAAQGPLNTIPTPTTSSATTTTAPPPVAIADLIPTAEAGAGGGGDAGSGGTGSGGGGAPRGGSGTTAAPSRSTGPSGGSGTGGGGHQGHHHRERDRPAPPHRPDRRMGAATGPGSSVHPGRRDHQLPWSVPLAERRPMADEHAQAQDHAWEAVDPAPDSPLPAP
ncbi:MAG: hypothetical protein ACRD1D_16300, partial [Acidimicrobiales bacterium]